MDVILVMCLMPQAIILRNYYHGLLMVSRRTGGMAVGGILRVGMAALAQAAYLAGWLYHVTAGFIPILGFAAEAVVGAVSARGAGGGFTTRPNPAQGAARYRSRKMWRSRTCSSLRFGVLSLSNPASRSRSPIWPSQVSLRMAPGLTPHSALDDAVGLPRNRPLAVLQPTNLVQASPVPIKRTQHSHAKFPLWQHAQRA